jgi:tetratricopeptide (TPR) repeat protein
VKTCTAAISGNDANMKAFYWRGQAYRDSGHRAEALQDLTRVAESEDDFRPYAAIDLSMIYFNQNDVQNALSVLNRYKYLYDPKTTDRSSVAVGYNNRCYAYMKLGELTKALDDCTNSLKYGSLPDAIRKRAELIRRISAHEGTL